MVPAAANLHFQESEQIPISFDMTDRVLKQYPMLPISMHT
jgi:hypothetical protein